MTNTIKLFATALFLLFSLLVPKTVSAETSDFTIDIDSTYDVSVNGTTNAAFSVTITNENDYTQAQSFILNLTNVTPYDIMATENGSEVPVTTERKEKNSLIKVFFDEPVRGKGATRSFKIYFTDLTIAGKSGEVWEISLPKIEKESGFNIFKTQVSVPEKFGELAYSSYDYSFYEARDGKKIYFFEKNGAFGGLLLAFGEFQVFSFKLSYHLVNPSNKKAKLEIAIPPDTSTQRMFYKSIEPLPLNVNVDPDGNWMASYNLAASENLDVEVSGHVQIFAGSLPVQTTSPTTLLANTKPTFYWQSDDSQIKNISQKLGSPREIYDFVIETLSYNYERVVPDAKRLGAKEALQNPSNAICTEFTDLFIALSRASGIPAREINGFAYSENPQIEPLSLVSDVLHAWPEYWDKDAQVWTPVDPTWAATSGGLDYFNKFDLKHFAFVIHGIQDSQPQPAGSYKLSSNPQKDVYVAFDHLPLNRSPNVEIKIEPVNVIDVFTKKLKIKLHNSGVSASYNEVLEVENAGIRESYFIPVLPPNSFVETSIALSYGLLGSKENILIVKTQDLEVTAPNYKNQIVVNQLILIITALFLTILFVYLVISKKLKFNYLKRFLPFKKD